MALDYFRISRGLQLESTIVFISGSGAPGGTTDTDNATVGSLYLDYSNGLLYTKNTSGTGSDKWATGATQSYVDQQLATAVSWREPVVVRDGSSTTLPTGTAGSTITVDGVTIDDGDRVLFSELSSDANVYTYDKANGVFVETANTETSGDTLYVQQGTYSGTRYTYNGTSWVQTDGTTVDELGYIRDFIGKSAQGAETPTYSSINFVTQGGDLEQAIGELDTELGPNVTSNTLILSTNTINDNIQVLGDFAEKNGKITTASSITTATDIDTITSVNLAKWIVYAVDSADSSKVQTFEILATHNGTSVDATKYAVLKLGNAIAGLDVNVNLANGTDLTLNITSTDSVNITAKRVAAE